jgi:hypothetical protein
LELPEFVNVTLRVLLAPRFTLPKLKLEVLAVKGPGAGLTVRVAALLLTLLTKLLTTTVNCAPLSAVVSAAVV